MNQLKFVFTNVHCAHTRNANARYIQLYLCSIHTHIHDAHETNREDGDARKGKQKEQTKERESKKIRKSRNVFIGDHPLG